MEAARRPRVSRRPEGLPGLESSQESLRRCPLARSMTRTAARRDCALRDERTFAFWRHDGIFRPGRGLKPRKIQGRVPPPVGRPRALVQGRDGRNCAPFSPSAMSSGRLSLDRVARQQSPSPFHRRWQNNMHLTQPRAKDDISTLPRTRHFYFALTRMA